MIDEQWETAYSDTQLNMFSLNQFTFFVSFRNFYSSVFDQIKRIKQINFQMVACNEEILCSSSRIDPFEHQLNFFPENSYGRKGNSMDSPLPLTIFKYLHSISNKNQTFLSLIFRRHFIDFYWESRKFQTNLWKSNISVQQKLQRSLSSSTHRISQMNGISRKLQIFAFFVDDVFHSVSYPRQI